MPLRRLVISTVSMLALASASQAFAQDASVDQSDNEDIVVTGIRASIIGALNVKRESVQVVDSIVAEDIGKLPDNNVVEALQRVTGVQVTNRGGGETGALSIRGMPDALTTMNGRVIFTGSGQAFALQDIPANLVKRIDVYKTRAAEQIETGLAGQINVFTRRPFDFDGFAMSGVARGIYNDQADSFNPNLSGLVSQRWETGIGEIGVLVNASYARTKWRDMSVTSGALVPFVTENPPAATGFTPLQRVFPETGAWRPGLDHGLPYAAGSTFVLNGVTTPYYLSRDAVFSPDVTGERERPAVNAAVQWSPNSSSTYTAEFFWTGFRQTTFNSLFFSFVDWWGSLGPNPGSTIDVYPDTNIIKSRTVGDVYGFNSGDITKARTDSFVYALNGEWQVGSGKIVADMAYQDSKTSSQFMAMRIDRVASQINVDFNSGGGIPSYNFNDNALLLDPKQWNVAQFYDNANQSSGSAFTVTLDADQNWDEGFLRSVKAGVRYDSRRAADDVRTQEAGCLCRNLSTLPEGLQYINSGFFDGRADVPTSWMNANGYYLFDHADEIRTLYQSVNPNLRLADQLSFTRVFEIEEKTMSMYVQGDAQIDIGDMPLRINAGLRYVDVDTNLIFNDRYNNGAQRTASQKTSRLLPSVTLRFDVTNSFRIRFNYGETLRRPAFADLNPNYSLTGDLTNVGYGSGSSGNINLKPTTSKNFDLGFEWFFDRDSAIYATLFRREIEGLVVPLTALVTVNNTGLNTNTFLVTRPENASDGVLKGIELGVVYFPHYLPGVLNGFGVQGSFTLLDSTQNIPQTDSLGNIIGQEESAFFGVSDFSYNVTLAYERGPIGARLSWVWRKEFLANNEARLFANPIGVWRRPEKSLDLQITAKITPRLGVTFDGTNLTNEIGQNYYRFGDSGGPDMFNLGSTLFARTFAIGVRYNFD